METGAAPNQVVRYQSFELNLRTRELYKSGQKLKLQGQPIDVLAMLLEKPGELVTREQLRKKLWPETTYVDFEHGLNSAINRLREALGDHADEPHFIETLPRLGYRFIVPLDPLFEEAKVPSPACPVPQTPAETGNLVTTKPPGRTTGTARRHWLLAVTGVVIGLLAAAVWYLRRPLPPPSITDVIQITHDGHRKYLAGIDGSRLYIGRWMPYIISQVGIAKGDIVPIPIALPDPKVDDVSPDGAALLVHSVNTKEQSLWSVEIPGGSLRRLAPDGVSGAWSPDGKSLVYSTANGDVIVARSDGSGAHTLVPARVLGERPYPRFFAWSPDKTKIRFSSISSGGIDRLFEVSADGSKLHQLLPGWHASSYQCCGAWTSDGNFYLFLSASPVAPGASYGSQIWALDERRGRLFRKSSSEPIQLTLGPIRWGLPIPSKDGRTIFDTGNILRGEVVRFDTKSHQLRAFMGGMSAEGFAFSPDGKSMAYVSYPEGILWRANRDGSNPIQLTNPPWYPILPRWSPDGTKILFFSTDTEGRSDKAFTISSLGGIPQPLLPADSGAQTDPNWSADGHKIVFATGTWGHKDSDIRILDLDSHEVSIVPGSVGLFSPRWPPGGRIIVASDSLTLDLKVFDLKTERWSLLQKGPLGWFAFSHDGHFIYFARSADDSSAGVFRIRTSGSNAERVCDLKGFYHAGVVNSWGGLDSDDAPLLLRDTGSYEIYALNFGTNNRIR